MILIFLPQEQLMLKNCQDLFKKYQIRVQHALFVELLLFNVIYNALALGGYVFLSSKVSNLFLHCAKIDRICNTFFRHLRCCYFTAPVFTYFLLTEVYVIVFQPGTIVARLHLIVLICKVFINYFLKRQFVVLLLA